MKTDSTTRDFPDLPGFVKVTKDTTSPSTQTCLYTCERGRCHAFVTAYCDLLILGRGYDRDSIVFTAGAHRHVDLGTIGWAKMTAPSKTAETSAKAAQLAIELADALDRLQIR